MENAKKTEPLRNWLSTAEAAELAGVEQGTIRQAINRGKLTSVMKGHSHLVRREHVCQLWNCAEEDEIEGEPELEPVNG